MSDKDPLTAALFRISQNQNALGCAIAELAKWADHCGQRNVADHTRHYLQILLDNSDALARAIDDLDVDYDRLENE